MSEQLDLRLDENADADGLTFGEWVESLPPLAPDVQTDDSATPTEGDGG